MKRKGHTGSWGSLVEKKESAEPFNPAWRRKWEEPKLRRDAMFQYSGFIIENVDKDGRSFDGQIEAYDLYYNIAAVQIQSDTPLPTASLAHLNDSITVDPSHSVKEESFQLRPHSNSLNLIPEDLVIVLGRFPIDPYSIMAAPGLFRQTQQLWFGMEVTNLYAAPLDVLESIIQKFPDVLEGVIVEDMGLVGTCSLEQVRSLAAIAHKCVHRTPRKRTSMDEISHAILKTRQKRLVKEDTTFFTGYDRSRMASRIEHQQDELRNMASTNEREAEPCAFYHIGICFKLNQH
ncbi:hypothetical protein FXO38_08686 [Capsicum annuum]|uniref:Uncharacterized protein n=1 Tax=Capsicum annuum TaxID=4072 RepID=A0A2G3ABV1_CAPAN|nr:hypothetical protein FXO38_08686 [Capsicum annuum]PHT91653.1 hypothetical protein T459_06766 [Capsicum annuum]